MKKESAWLLDELPALVAKGVLDEAAAARLRAHYGAGAAAAGVSWGLILLASGGAALVGLGVVLIFAHNWEGWTPGVRVALSLLPLAIGQLACAYALRRPSRAAGEAAGLFTGIAAGASIALIAQTYQFGGDLPRFLLTWLLLAIPLAYLLDASTVAVGSWILATGWAVASPHAWWLQAGSMSEALRLPAFLALFALPLPHLIHHARLDRASARVAWLLRAAILALVVGLALAAGGPDRSVLPLTYAALAAAGALAGLRWFGGVHGVWGNPLLTAGQLGVFAMALSLTVKGALAQFAWPSSSAVLLPVLLALASAWLAWRLFSDGDRLVAPLLGVFPVLAFGLPEVARASLVLAVLLANAYVLALAAAYVRSGLAQARLARANFGVALLAALVLLRFFDSDLSYVLRGVGFIVTGAGFFGATLWLRRRVRTAAP